MTLKKRDEVDERKCQKAPNRSGKQTETKVNINEKRKKNEKSCDSKKNKKKR